MCNPEIGPGLLLCRAPSSLRYVHTTAIPLLLAVSFLLCRPQTLRTCVFAAAAAAGVRAGRVGTAAVASPSPGSNNFIVKFRDSAVGNGRGPNLPNSPLWRKVWAAQSSALANFVVVQADPSSASILSALSDVDWVEADSRFYTADYDIRVLDNITVPSDTVFADGGQSGSFAAWNYGESACILAEMPSTRSDAA